MNLRELINRARSETGDTANPPLWSNAEWREYLNEAAVEAAIRAKLIEDDQIEIDITAGESHAEYPAYVWAIQRVYFGGRKLDLVDREMIDADEGEGWEDKTGQPVACYEVGGRLRLFPTPEAGGSARLVAFCTPREPMVDDADEPGIRQARLHPRLIDWALHLAYLKKDSDTFDAGLSRQHEAEFEKNFGPRPDEKAMRQKRINVRRRVAGHSF